MVKGIIFDVDNTLIDFMRMKKISISEAIDAMIDAGLKMSHKKAFDILHELFGEMGIEGRSLFQKFSKRALGKVDDKIVAAAVITHRRIWSGFLHTYPGVIRTLIELKKKGLKLCIVSDARRFHVYERLYAMRIIDFFDVIVTHNDTKKFKPSRRPFVHALHKVKLKPEDCVMVGDWMKGDVMGAQKMGMKGCLAHYGRLNKFTKTMSDKNHLKKVKCKPNYVLKKFPDILEVVENSNT
jgi:HAD superfamily hydrolase (TIGR02253 family)